MVGGLFVVVLLLGGLKLNCGELLLVGAIPITDLLRFCTGDCNLVLVAIGTLAVVAFPLLWAATFDMITEAAATAPAGGPAGAALPGDPVNWGLLVVLMVVGLIKNGAFFASWW